MDHTTESIEEATRDLLALAQDELKGVDDGEVKKQYGRLVLAWNSDCARSSTLGWRSFMPVTTASATRFLIERKSYRDLEVSVVDGRLFRQAARLAHEAARGLILVEGPKLDHPRVHPHAIAGAILSLAVDWRLPVVFTDGPDESLVLLRLIAEHHVQPPSPFVARHEYKPKRLTHGDCTCSRAYRESVPRLPAGCSRVLPLWRR